MTKGKNQHVVKHPDGWAVKGAGNSKATPPTIPCGKSRWGSCHWRGTFENNMDNYSPEKLPLICYAGSADRSLGKFSCQ